MPTSQVLVLAAGATKGFAMLGCLAYLEESKKLIEFDIIVGSSIGAILAVLIASGLSAIEIFAIACSENWGSDFSVDNISLQDLFLSNCQGLFSFKKLSDRVRKILVEKTGLSPSLLQLYEHTHIHLILVSYNLTKRQTEYISHLSNPDLSVVDAVQMSCSLPIIFHKCEINSQIYVDGAISDGYAVQFAMDHFPSSQITAIATKTCSLDFTPAEDHYRVSDRTSPISNNPLLSYLRQVESKTVQIRDSILAMLQLLAQLIEIWQSVVIKQVETLRSKRLVYIHIPLQPGEIMGCRFDLSTPKKLELYLIGYEFGQKNRRKLSQKQKRD